MASDAEVDAYYAKYFQRMQESVNKQARKAYDETWKEWLKYVAGKAQEIMKGVAEDFYASYTPQFYKRRGSLYNLLVINLEDSGETFEGHFNESAITFRNGYGGEDGLYDQVFRRGWHGGAGSIDASKEAKMGAHPSPGYPYWRTPYSPPDSKKTGYYHWGRPADISYPAPLDVFKSRWDKFLTIDGYPYYYKIYREKLSRIKPFG